VSELSPGACAVIHAAVITISDKGFAGERTDESGAVLEEALREMGVESVQRALVPDERELIAAKMRHFAEAPDVNAAATQRSRAQKDADWEFVVKMTMIGRDLMVGNPRLAELGYADEAMGHNALASGFQGHRQWTDAVLLWQATERGGVLVTFDSGVKTLGRGTLSTGF